MCFSFLHSPRDEAGMAVVGDDVYILGGIGQDTVEKYSLESIQSSWTEVMSMPESLARSCVVTIGDNNTILIIGRQVFRLCSFKTGVFTLIHQARPGRGSLVLCIFGVLTDVPTYRHN